MRVALKAESWQRALDQLGKTNAIKAGIRAVNRTLSNARTAMVRVVSQDMGLASKPVRDKIETRVAKPTGEAPRGYLFADTRGIPLINFGATGPRPSRGKGRGVKAKLKPPGKGRYPYAFIATLKSGHEAVLERYDAAGRRGARGPKGGRTYQLHGPSIAHVFQKNGNVAEARAAEMLEKNMASEMAYLIRQATQ